MSEPKHAPGPWKLAVIRVGKLLTWLLRKLTLDIDVEAIFRPKEPKP